MYMAHNIHLSTRSFMLSKLNKCTSSFLAKSPVILLRNGSSCWTFTSLSFCVFTVCLSSERYTQKPICSSHSFAVISLCPKYPLKQICLDILVNGNVSPQHGNCFNKQTGLSGLYQLKIFSVSSSLNGRWIFYSGGRWVFDAKQYRCYRWSHKNWTARLLVRIRQEYISIRQNFSHVEWYFPEVPTVFSHFDSPWILVESGDLAGDKKTMKTSNKIIQKTM